MGSHSSIRQMGHSTTCRFSQRTGMLRTPQPRQARTRQSCRHDLRQLLLTAGMPWNCTDALAAGSPCTHSVLACYTTNNLLRNSEANAHRQRKPSSRVSRTLRGVRPRQHCQHTSARQVSICALRTKHAKHGDAVLSRASGPRDQREHGYARTQTDIHTRRRSTPSCGHPRMHLAARLHATPCACQAPASCRGATLRVPW